MPSGLKYSRTLQAYSSHQIPKGELKQFDYSHWHAWVMKDPIKYNPRVKLPESTKQGAVVWVRFSPASLAKLDTARQAALLPKDRCWLDVGWLLGALGLFSKFGGKLVIYSWASVSRRLSTCFRFQH